jgi:predicted RNase H-like HicB family nuclease
MLVEYIEAAMRKGVYELLADNEGFFGRIPECPGVWANAPTLEACREELQSVLEDWILIKLRHNDTDFVVIDGIDLNPVLAGNVSTD